jgi:hypothetical protein
MTLKRIIIDHKEHMFADLIERQLTFFCGIEQKTYDEDIERLYEREINET